MKKFLPIIIAGLGFGAYFFLKIKDKEKEKEKEKEKPKITPEVVTIPPAPLPPPPNVIAPSYSNWWSQNFTKNSPDASKKFKTTSLLSSAYGTSLAQKINSSLNWINDADVVIAIFRDLSYQTQVTSLAYYFNKSYQTDLYNYLKSQLFDAELKKIEDGIKTLPTGKIY